MYLSTFLYCAVCNMFAVRQSLININVIFTLGAKPGAFNGRNLPSGSSSLLVEGKSDDDDLNGGPTEGDDVHLGGTNKNEAGGNDNPTKAGGNDNPTTSSVQQQKSSPSKSRKQTSSGTACSWKCQGINMYKGQPCGKNKRCTSSACFECSKMATGEENLIVCHAHASKADKERWHKCQQSSTVRGGKSQGGGVRTYTTHKLNALHQHMYNVTFNVNSK